MVAADLDIIYKVTAAIVISAKMIKAANPIVFKWDAIRRRNYRRRGRRSCWTWRWWRKWCSGFRVVEVEDMEDKDAM